MKQQATKKTKEGTTIMKKKSDSVSTIKKFFEKTDMSIPVPTCVPSQNIHNNNGVFVATANQILAAVGSQADPEMALQVAAAGQPTGSEIGKSRRR